MRIAGNDYSVDPGVIGRFVDVHAGLDTVTITCAGTKARTAAMRGPTTRPVTGLGAVVGVRALSDYDALFDLTPAITDEAAVAARANLEIVR